MTIQEVKPAIRQFKYRQEKGDPEYGTCLWAIFNLDTENYTLTIESDCGNYSYGWIPTPNSESFIHLMSRVEEGYLLGKISNETEFDYKASKAQTIQNIKWAFESEPEDIDAILIQIDSQECISDMKYSDRDFYHEMDDILSDYDCCDRFEIINCVMDYTAQAKRIAHIFCTVLQPILKEECKKEEHHD